VHSHVVNSVVKRQPTEHICTKLKVTGRPPDTVQPSLYREQVACQAVELHMQL
jgi:hypothetical protein